MTGDQVALVLGCALVCAALKAAGPMAIGGRDLPDGFKSVVALLAPALLAALVVTETLAPDRHFEFGPSSVGVAAGGLVAWRTGSEVAAVVVAAVVAATVRAA